MSLIIMKDLVSWSEIIELVVVLNRHSLVTEEHHAPRRAPHTNSNTLIQVQPLRKAEVQVCLILALG